MFVSHSDFNDIAPFQYDQGYEWLRESGMLENEHSSAPPAQRIFDAAVLNGRPFWLRDADDLVRNPDELPEDVVLAARTLEIDVEEAFSRVSSIWQKVDTEERSRIGAAGEAALIDLLRSTTSARTDHVSERSDAYGYDISVVAPDVELHLEVKSTNRRGRVKHYLSRNEFEVMKQDPAWRLVSIRLDQELNIVSIGVVNNAFIKSIAPNDVSPYSRWDSVRLTFPEIEVENGLRELEGCSRNGAPENLVRLLIGSS